MGYKTRFSFSVKRVQSYQFIREEEVTLLVNSISHYASSATPIDLSETLFALTASITFRTGFGKSFRGNGLDNESFERLLQRWLLSWWCYKLRC